MTIQADTDPPRVLAEDLQGVLMTVVLGRKKIP